MRNILLCLLILLTGTVAVIPAIQAGEIHRAIEQGDQARVTELLAADPALVSAQDENQTRDYPLHVAAIGGHIEIASQLIEAGAEVDCGDSDLSTPLHVAALRSQPAMVEFLLAQGADPAFQDNNGGWSLSFAVSGNATEVIRILIDAGAPMTLRNAQGISLVHWAALRNNPDLLTKALAAGLDVNDRTTDGMTALHYAAMGGAIPMIDQLTEAGMSIDAANEDGLTPMVMASWRGQTEAIAALLDRGADLDQTDQFGRNLAWMAASSGQPELARLVIDCGIDVNAQTHFGETPLHAAAQNGNTEITQALLNAGARADAHEARTGFTPLHLAAINGYGDIVEAICEAGGCVQARDRNSASAADLAQNYGHKAIATKLAEQGAPVAEPVGPCPSATGCLVSSQAAKKKDCERLAKGEAKLWYLGHSGYALQTRNNLLIFDYFGPERAPDQPALCNGCIRPEELAGQKVTVFVSHEHGDHFDQNIFTWADQVEGIRYVTGCTAETEQPYELLAPRTVTDREGMKIRTIDSNDTGLGFLVEVDGVTIYHAGDHANRLRDFSGPYCAEIDYLAETGIRPDFAMMPISGCNFGDQEAVRLGVMYALDKLQPKVFIPLHSLNREFRYREFTDACRDDYPAIKMVAPGHRGDHYKFSKGKIS